MRYGLCERAGRTYSAWRGSHGGRPIPCATGACVCEPHTGRAGAGGHVEGVGRGRTRGSRGGPGAKGLCIERKLSMMAGGRVYHNYSLLQWSNRATNATWVRIVHPIMFQLLADGGSGMAPAAMIVGGMATAQSTQRHADRQLGGVATAATTHATRYGDRVRVSIHIYIYIYRCVSFHSPHNPGLVTS